MHTAEPLVPRPSSVKIKVTIEKPKRYKSPGIDQILAELIQAGGDSYVMKSRNLLILFGIRNNCHTSGRNLLSYVFIKRVIKMLPTTYKLLLTLLLSRLTPYVDEIIWDYQYGF